MRAMAFRDQTRALRERAEALNRELEDVRRQRDEFEEEAEGKEALEDRVRKLEKELDKLRPKKAKKKGSKSGWLSTSSGKKWVRVLAAASVVLVGGVGVAVLSGSEGIDLSEAIDFGGGLPITTDGAPVIGMIDLQRTLEPMPAPAVANGAVGASEVQAGCSGYVPEDPQVIIRTREPMHVWVNTTSSADLVMVVVTQDGIIHCDDDSGDNHDPRIDLTLPPGDHRVWVGPYTAGEEHPFSLHVRGQPADAVPDETGLASRGEPSLGIFEPSGEEPASGSWQGSSQGMVSAATLKPVCRGWLTIGPQLVLKLAEPTVVRLRVESAHDMVLLVRMADGTIRCDDDGGEGNAPLIAGLLPAGEHRVWVGSFQEQHTAYGLYADARPGGTASHPSGLAVNAPPTLGRVEVSGTASTRYEGATRGFIAVSPLGQGCRGFTPLEPHFDLALAEGRDIELHAQGRALVVLIRHPDGGFECDSGEGRVRGMWQAGLHKIWIGVQGSDQESHFSLNIRATEPSIQPWSPRP